jgi:outer membrane receptor protein involved in Fe transport
VRLLREPELHLNVEIRNLFDDRTIEDDFMNPLPGRTIFVTLRVGNAERKP